MKYYQEEIEKNTKYRAEYVSSIDEFLQMKRCEIDKIREDFISPKRYIENPERYRQQFIELLGFPLTEKRKMPIAEKIFIAKDNNVNIYRMQFTLFGGIKFYGIYFEQCENPKNAPFLFGFHGGQGTPELISSIHFDSANYNHLVRRATDKKANVFAPQFLLWDQELYGNNNCNRKHTDGKLRQLGGSITAMELYLLQSCLDYFIEKEELDKEKIGCMGLSYGGMYALHLAAIDTRIKACYSCSWVNDSFVNSWPDWSYLNAQKYFTTAETMALVAPRALVVAMGDKDQLFSYKLTVAECEKAKLYYKELNMENNFKYIIFDGEHEADKNDIELNFLFQHLKI